MTLPRLARRRGVAGPLDGGTVTAETAIALPAVVVLLAALLAAIGWSSQYLRCQQAAGDVARAVVRGESDAAVHELAERLVPPGAELTIARHTGQVHVTVTAHAGDGAGVLRRALPPITVVSTVPDVP